MMKILFVGLGSIGQRHLRNLSKLYGDEAEFIAFRKRRLQRTFSDDMKIREGINLEKEYKIRSFDNMADALAEKPQICIISNVTSEHMPCALQAAQAGCHIFLEKPVSDSMNGVEELIKTAKEKAIKIFVGFQNRYHPAIKMAKKYIKDGSLGNMISIYAEVGERLTTMHSYEDYKDTYMARSELGGGVILNQMIHEIDYLSFLFGTPKYVCASGSMGKSLSIDVDDCCSALLSFNGIPAVIHTDFYQYPPRRCFLIVGSRGKIFADILNNKIQICIGDEVTDICFDKFKRNDMFIEEMQRFMDCIKSGKASEIDIHDGIAALKIALEAKKYVAESCNA